MVVVSDMGEMTSTVTRLASLENGRVLVLGETSGAKLVTVVSEAGEYTSIVATLASDVKGLVYVLGDMSGA